MRKTCVILGLLLFISVVSAASGLDQPTVETASHEMIAPSTMNDQEVSFEGPQSSLESESTGLRLSTSTDTGALFGQQWSLLPCGAKCASNSACESGLCEIPSGCYTGLCSCEGP